MGKAVGRCGDNRKKRTSHQSQFIQFNILNFKPFNLYLSVAGNVYVLFRNKHPKLSTVLEALKVLQTFNIDFNQFVEWPVDMCQ
jgi:hypothetical protein